MENLQQATEKICDLKGTAMALESIICALASVLSPDQRRAFLGKLEGEKESALSVLLGASVSEWTVEAYQRDIQRLSTRFPPD